MSRRVRIASCSVLYEPGTSSYARALELVRQAGEMKADIVCLPEFSAAPVKEGHFAPESVPGPATQAFAELAADFKMYVIVPLLEDVGQSKYYNTAVLLDRAGQIVGKYRKTHLCLPVCHEGDTTMAGDELPVFQTDFGTIGITTCMDIHYPRSRRQRWQLNLPRRSSSGRRRRWITPAI